MKLYTVHLEFKGENKWYHDNTAGIFSNWEKATEVALLHCGENAKERFDPEELDDEDFDRATDIREFDGDKAFAWIICSILDEDLYLELKR